MIQVRKPWPWCLQNGYTTIWPFLFYADIPATGLALDHEEIHAGQQKRWLLIPYLIFYGLALPVLFNPMRYRWEWEAYKIGSGYQNEEIKEILASSFYGWLPYWLNGWAVPKKWKN